MNKTMIKEKLNRLEAEIKLIKVGLSQPIDLGIDDKNWSSIKATAKKARARIYKEQYA